METKEILELSGMALSLPVMGYCLSTLKDKYINWADKNKFFDEDVKFENPPKRREEYKYFSGEGEY
jgi:hypothetical protein